MADKNDDPFPMSSDFIYECALFFWKMVVSIFFREIRPRGAYNIPREGPVILVVAPHHNQVCELLFSSCMVYSFNLNDAQFLDPLQVAIQVHRETRRRTRFLIAAVSMKRKAVGFFASLMSSSAYPKRLLLLKEVSYTSI
jgi:glycerol-3-phosphate O-acyltransferase / dihydroxyacetone phosphate acyltransferase